MRVRLVFCAMLNILYSGLYYISALLAGAQNFLALFDYHRAALRANLSGWFIPERKSALRVLAASIKYFAALGGSLDYLSLLALRTGNA